MQHLEKEKNAGDTVHSTARIEKAIKSEKVLKFMHNLVF